MNIGLKYSMLQNTLSCGMKHSLTKQLSGQSFLEKISNTLIKDKTHMHSILKNDTTHYGKMENEKI